MSALGVIPIPTENAIEPCRAPAYEPCKEEGWGQPPIGLYIVPDVLVSHNWDRLCGVTSCSSTAGTVYGQEDLRAEMSVWDLASDEALWKFERSLKS